LAGVSGRGRAHARRPPTPPYVRFRIRRFLSTGQTAQRAWFRSSCRLSANEHRDQLRCCRPLSLIGGSRVTTRLPPCPRREHARLSTHDKFSPSSLWYQATTTASADFCQPIPTPRDVGSTRQIDRPPRVRRATFAAYTRRIYFLIFRMVLGFEFFGPLAQMRLPLCGSCSSGHSFAYSFLQIPTHAGHPCCSANGSSHQGP